MSMKRRRTTPSGSRGSRSRGGVRDRHNVVTSENDNLSKALADLVPDEFRGTDRYLDVVQWNLEWFGAQKSLAKDKKRFGLVLDILTALNGDLFIFQEVTGPSKDGRYPGALDAVADELTKRGAGEYVVSYTDAGGEQRVAMMWDREWLRSKITRDPPDLFPAGAYKMSDGKDPFAQRTPFYGYFEARIPATSHEPDLKHGGGSNRFDFQALGVHLKAMGEGHPQRLASAEVLAKWLTAEAPKIDSDAFIMGDWNAPPDDSCWAPLHTLEQAPQSKVVFQKINDPSDFSYLWLANRSDKYVSRIDLSAMTLSSMQQVVGKAAQVVHWKPIQDVLAQAGDITAKKVKDVMAQLKDSISDHMPVVTRFYFTE